MTGVVYNTGAQSSWVWVSLHHRLPLPFPTSTSATVPLAFPSDNPSSSNRLVHRLLLRHRNSRHRHCTQRSLVFFLTLNDQTDRLFLSISLFVFLSSTLSSALIPSTGSEEPTITMGRGGYSQTCTPLEREEVRLKYFRIIARLSDAMQQHQYQHIQIAMPIQRISRGGGDDGRG